MRPLSRGLARERLPQRRQEVREDREVVEPHRRRPRRQRRDEPRAVRDHDPPAGHVDLGHQRLHERHQRLAAVGRRDAAAGPARRRAPARRRCRAARRPRRTPRGRPAGGRRTRRGPPATASAGIVACSTMPRAASAAVRSGSSSKATSSTDWCRREPATVSGAQGRRRARRGLGAQRAAGREPPLGLVGAYVDGDLAAQAVRLADPADHDLYISRAVSGVGRHPRSRSARRPCRPAPR